MAPKEKRDSLSRLEEQLMALTTRFDEERSTDDDEDFDDESEEEFEEDMEEEEQKDKKLEIPSHTPRDDEVSCLSLGTSLGDLSDDDNDTLASSWRSGVDLFGGDDEEEDESIATTKSQALAKLNQARNSASALLDLEKMKLEEAAAAVVQQFPRRGSLVQSIPRPCRRSSFLPKTLAA